MNISLNFFNQVSRVERARLKGAAARLSGCALLLIFGILLAGCAAKGQGSPFNLRQQTPFYRPPTPQFAPVEAQGTGTPGQPGESGPGPSPTTPCKDNLTFKKDITIPDGTVVNPDVTLDKRWEVENSGNCNWDSSYRVRLIAGPELGAQKEQALYPARSGSQAVIRIVFKAPLEPGAYRSAWQAFNTQGEPFGDPFFVDIKVQAP